LYKYASLQVYLTCNGPLSGFLFYPGTKYDTELLRQLRFHETVLHSSICLRYLLILMLGRRQIITLLAISNRPSNFSEWYRNWLFHRKNYFSEKKNQWAIFICTCFIWSLRL